MQQLIALLCDQNITDYIVITPNRRQSAFLHHEFGKFIAKPCWETPKIVPLGVWLEELFELVYLFNNIDKPRVLSSIEQQLIIEKVINASEETSAFLRVSATAAKIATVIDDIANWELELDELYNAPDFGVDAEIFCKWLSSYQDEIQSCNYITKADIPKIIINNIASVVQNINLKTVYFVGFDDFSPVIKKLIDELRNSNLSIVIDKINTYSPSRYKAEFNSLNDELAYIAMWAKKSTENFPDKNIGIVIPGLQELRDKVFNIFTKYLPAKNINMSAPKPMADYMVFKVAFILMKLNLYENEFSDISILLRSRYLNSIEDLKEAAKNETQIRDQLIRYNTDKVKSKHIDNFDAVFAIKKNLPKKSWNWLPTINSILQAAGWPGAITNEIDEELLVCWNLLTEEYVKVTGILGQHSYMEAVNVLNRLAIATPFLPETKSAKIHVLGLLEGTGLVFDELWVQGLTSDVWPQPAKPNPFIPLSVQRKYNMPHCSQERELEIARSLTNTLYHSAKAKLYFSYAKFNEEKEFNLSHLLKDLDTYQITAQNSESVIGSIEYFEDNFELRVNSNISGGSNIIKNQAECPFKGFAKTHMNSNALKNPDSLINRLSQGNLVHNILAKFWNKYKTHNNLIAMAEEDLEQNLSQIIDSEIKVDYGLYKIEKYRLKFLLINWLSFEKTREEFSVVGVEKKQELILNKVKLNLRIDRIDKTKNNEYVIIDYKTGNVDLNDCFRDRIQDVQLPLYSIVFDHAPSDVVYGVIKADKIEFKSVAKKVNLQEQIINWNKQLNMFAGEIISGRADIMPYSTATCTYCDLKSLCRITT